MGETDFAIYGHRKVVENREQIALTVGNFDGVHLGHRHVIDTLRKLSGQRPSVALTFDPHPSRVLSGESAKPALTSLTQRIELLLAAGVDAVVVQKFSPEFARLTADQFVFDYLLKAFDVSVVVIGFDFCYGTQRLGNWQHLSESAVKKGFIAEQATPLIVDGLPVSSSRIRSTILNCDFAGVRRMLGRDFCLSGIVVKGDQRGRLIGFPTANMGLMDQGCLVPAYGVYAVEVAIEGEDKLRPGVMNCGVRPTIAEGLKLQIETHILDFSGDLYGRSIRFSLKKFIRTEMKFSDLEHLKRQIQSDVNEARIFFGV